VPYPIVRLLFIQQELGERRGNWMTTIQEYYLEFKPSNIVEGKGFFKLVIESWDAISKKEEVG